MNSIAFINEINIPFLLAQFKDDISEKMRTSRTHLHKMKCRYLFLSYSTATQ